MNKTLYLTKNSNIVVDSEDNSCYKLQQSRSGVDYIYRITEPIHVVYGYRDEKLEFDCDKDDLIVTFYLDNIKHPLVVVKNKEWIENIEAYEKAQQAEKERWAAQKKQQESTNDASN